MEYEEVGKSTVKHSCGSFLYEYEIKIKKNESRTVGVCKKCKQVVDKDIGKTTELAEYKTVIFGVANGVN